MPDLSAIAGAFAAIKSLKEMALAMIALRDAEAFKAKLREFNALLIDAQDAVFAVNQERAALVERVGELEKQIVDLEAWGAEKQRYELADVGNGALAYRVKEAMRGAEPPHQICARCYEENHKSLLQEERLDGGRTRVLHCSRCLSDIYTHGSWLPAHASRHGAARRPG